MVETYIFGMAKSSLNLIGAKRQKLELDYLRLAYACQHYQKLGHHAHGFLAVATAAIKEQAKQWETTYKVPSEMVKVIAVDLEPEEIAQLAHYQSLNRMAMSGALDKATAARHADATYGRQLVENRLMLAVQGIYPGVAFEPDCPDPEMCISWDLFGKF
jgi:hypothetical protein